MSDLSATLAEARDYFLEADFEMATEKFEAAKAAAVTAEDADGKVAADTGLAEVAIQRKEWENAVHLLEAAVAVLGAKPAGLVRARYMLGLARMAQGRAEEARTEFEAALDVSRGAEEQGHGNAAAAGIRGDIEDRLAQLDELESLEEEDLLEIAMEFGASAADDEYNEHDDDEEEEDEEEEDDGEEDDDVVGEVGVVCADDDDDDEEEEEEEEDEEAEDDEEAAEAAASAPGRKRKANGDGAAAAAAASDEAVEEKRAKAGSAANGVAHAHATSDGAGDKSDQE